MAGKKKDLAKLVEVFSQAVAAQTEAIWRGDARAGNKHAKRYIAAFKSLREAGDDGRNALAVLLGDENRPDVRTMAAAFLLRHRTNDALAVLRKVAEGKGLIPFEAAQAIKRWEDGTWALDLPDGNEEG